MKNMFNDERIMKMKTQLINEEENNNRDICDADKKLVK